jgi:hypothetical protein
MGCVAGHAPRPTAGAPRPAGFALPGVTTLGAVVAVAGAGVGLGSTGVGETGVLVDVADDVIVGLGGMSVDVGATVGAVVGITVGAWDVGAGELTFTAASSADRGTSLEHAAMRPRARSATTTRIAPGKLRIHVTR